MTGLMKTLALAALALAGLGQTASAQDTDQNSEQRFEAPATDQPSERDTDQSLKLYAVRVIEGVNDVRSGNGIYLGTGLIITAAHVAGDRHSINIGISEQELPAEVVKRGQSSTVDLALLSIDDRRLPVSLRLRRMPLCKRPPWPSEQVIVVTPEAVAQSRVIAPFSLPYNLDAKYRTAISDVATTGNSGSGVFDENEKCLLGIISAKITGVRRNTANGQTTEESYDVAKYFVPSPLIADFIPPQMRF
jgi:S1-C subfamily serine protease